MQFVYLFDKSSEQFNIHSGFPRSSHLGFLIFYVFINTVIGSHISPCHILVFADDVKIVQAILFIDDGLIHQNALITFSKQCNEPMR